jgi:hypothetical protein
LLLDGGVAAFRARSMPIYDSDPILLAKRDFLPKDEVPLTFAPATVARQFLPYWEKNAYFQ